MRARGRPNRPCARLRAAARRALEHRAASRFTNSRMPCLSGYVESACPCGLRPFDLDEIASACCCSFTSGNVNGMRQQPALHSSDLHGLSRESCLYCMLAPHVGNRYESAGIDRLVAHERAARPHRARSHLREGPLWRTRERAFYFVDIVGDTIYRWTAGKARDRDAALDQANGLTFDLAGASSSPAGLRVPSGASSATARSPRSRRTMTARSSTARTTSSLKSDGSMYWTDSPVASSTSAWRARTFSSIAVPGVFPSFRGRKKLTLVVEDCVYRTVSRSRRTSACST